MLGKCRSAHVRTMLADYRIHNRRMSNTMADTIKTREDQFKLASHNTFGTDKFLDNLGQQIALNKVNCSAAPQGHA